MNEVFRAPTPPSGSAGDPSRVTPVPAPSPTPEVEARPPVGPGPSGGSRPVDDFGRPSSARVYDFLLGGSLHGEVDRALGARLLRVEPMVASAARENRSFLRRAVRHLLAAGVDQFLDLGSGMPTMGNVHEVVARSGAAASVVYVDLDPVAASHGARLLEAVPDAVFVHADLRDVDSVLAAAGDAGVVDLTRPVGLLAFSVLQHVPDADDPAGLLARYLERLAPGSALALSHMSADDPRVGMAAVETVLTAYPRSAPRARTAAEVARLLAPVGLVAPGLTWASMWRPDPGRPPRDRDLCAHLAGVGFRPPGPPRPDHA